jgi:hypothetical protein
MLRTHRKLAELAFQVGVDRELAKLAFQVGVNLKIGNTRQGFILNITKTKSLISFVRIQKIMKTDRIDRQLALEIRVNLQTRNACQVFVH